MPHSVTDAPTNKFRLQKNVGEKAEIIGEFDSPEEAISIAWTQNCVIDMEGDRLPPLFVFRGGVLVHGPAYFRHQHPLETA
jgi:hypothetical protein